MSLISTCPVTGAFVRQGVKEGMMDPVTAKETVSASARIAWASRSGMSRLPARRFWILPIAGKEVSTHQGIDA
ncbi:hypothetical protein [Sagittula salina]|uniref:Uncharacterized protein n=1 Tax=Sagittula salina TaxID=2820268 RepID=A0A940MSE1_9RHOB|nr:hypothetical protein [Sagittula salina]MBP0483818.1 hypothetical protein [Sagittula salina]